MTINQVQLSNTFNEFRQTVNNISNTLNAFTDTPVGPGEYSADSIYATGLYSNTVQVSTLTNGRVVFAGANGAIVDDSGITYDSASDRLTTTNATVDTNLQVNGTVGISGVTTITGNTVFGSGANKTRIFAANGNVIVSDRLDADHIHAVAHVGSGGDVEDWATTKGDNANTHKVFAVANTNAPIDMMVVNQNEGDSAYAEFIAIHATGNTVDGWTSFGINSSNYAEGAYGITKADDAYILYQAPVGTVHSGDLVIGTGSNGTGNRIIFSANGFDDPANNTQLVITPGQNIHVEIDTESSNATSGALTVVGGIGLQGNLNVGGNVAITGTITLGGGGNTVSTDSLAVDNPIIYLGANNAADVLDLGVVGTYNDGSTKYVGLVRDATDGIIKFFANTTTLPTSTVNFAEAGLVYPTLRFGSLHLEDDTSSSSKTTGALIVDGGAGIGGAVYADSFTANTGATINEFSIDPTLAGASNTAIPTEWAVKTYIDNNSGTVAWTTKTANYTAVAGDNLFCDTTTGSFAITLPASPSNNDSIKIADAAGTFGSRPLIVNHNGNRIQGTIQTLYLDLINSSVTLTYNTTYGWRII